MELARRLHIAKGGREPLYRQIAEGIRQEILQGRLPPGVRLPSCRDLARGLDVNLVTVVGAYRELARARLVAAQVGRGTFVASSQPSGTFVQGEPPGASPPGAPALIWREAPDIPERVGPLRGPLPPDIISFAGGLPDPALLPVARIGEILEHLLRREGAAALQYHPPQGFAPLREAIAKYLAPFDIAASPADVFISSGASQALLTAGRLLLRPGDVALVEAPTYQGALAIFEGLGARLVGVPVDEAGLRVDLLEAMIREYRPRCLYCIPSFHNPTGLTLPIERRRALLTLAGRYRLPVIEDDHMNEIAFEPPLPPLRALDRSGLVIYLKSFAKLLAPAVRVGALLAPPALHEAMLRAKQQVDPYVSTLMQRLLHRALADGLVEEQARRLPSRYRRRRDLTLAALRAALPAGCRWTTPAGGLNLWVRLPDGISATGLLPRALAAGVAFMPGPIFFPDRSGDDALRLSFGAVPERDIAQGIEQLGRLIGRERRRAARAAPAELAPGLAIV